MGDVAFEDAGKESEFQAAQAAFLHPPRVQQKSVTLLITLAAYVALSLGTNARQSLTTLAILVGVLFVHELGHAAGMMMFGYTDVRIFFIPLFGAAAAGRRRGVARWKQGVVLLLGPVPGLIAGVAMLALEPVGLVRTGAIYLVFVNALNLLPVAPFDGGQLFQLLWFSRRRALELGFLVVAGLALIVGAIVFRSWIFGVIGYFVLITVPFRNKLLAAAQRLRAAELPADAAALDEPQRRLVFDALWAWMPGTWRGKPRPQAAAMESLLELATRQPLAVGAAAWLFAAWLAALGVAVVGVIAVVRPPPVHWHVYHHRDPAFTIELPASPEIREDTQVLAAMHGRDRAWSVVWRPHGEGSTIDWARLVGDGKLIRDDRGWGDEDHRVYRIAAGTLHVLTTTASDGTWFAVTAQGPADDADGERVIRSFRTGE